MKKTHISLAIALHPLEYTIFLDSDAKNSNSINIHLGVLACSMEINAIWSRNLSAIQFSSKLDLWFKQNHQKNKLWQHYEDACEFNCSLPIDCSSDCGCVLTTIQFMISSFDFEEQKCQKIKHHIIFSAFSSIICNLNRSHYPNFDIQLL